MFCRNCGQKLKEGAKFCENCGAKLVSPLKEAEQKKPVNMTQQFLEQKKTAEAAGKAPERPAPAKKELEIAEEKAERPKKSKKGLFIALTALVLVGVFLFTAFAFPGFLKSAPEGSDPTSGGGSPAKVKTSYYVGSGFEDALVSDQSGGADIGTLKENGLRLHIGEGALPSGSKVSAKPIAVDTLKKIGTEGKFERVVAAFDLSCEGYDGSPLSDVELTVSMPKLNSESAWDEGTYVFCYYDRDANQMRCFRPDSIDKKKNTMTLSLPHFSWWWGAKLTREEEISLFLDEYCMALALQQDQNAKLSEELNPYVQAKTEALGLTKTAAADFAQAIITALGGAVSFEGEYGETAGDLAGLTYNQFVTLGRAYWDNDKEGAQTILDDTLSGLAQQLWKEGKYSERAAKVFKSEYIKEFVPGSIDTFIQNFGSFGTVLGAIWENDAEGAAKEVGKILEGVHPAVSISTRGLRLLACGINTWFINWKAVQIDELYLIYKDGAKGLFGNEVDARDRASFLTFLNTSSGFTKAKGVGRFYQLDNIEKVCRRYGWNYKTYAELPEKYRVVFEQRAEEELLDYFETRAKLEDAANKLKEKIRPRIEAMLTDGYGALDPDQYGAFFHEDSYDVRARLTRIVRIKSFLSLYVDEEKVEYSERNGGNGWGNVINWWLMYALSNGKSAAIRLLIKDLKEYDLLKEGMDAEFDGETSINRFLGEWTGIVSYTVRGSNYTNQIKNQYRFVIKIGDTGRLKIYEYRKNVEYNGVPAKASEKEEHIYTDVLDDDEYTVLGGTLTVIPRDGEFMGDYLYKFSFRPDGKLMMSHYLGINNYLVDWKTDPEGRAGWGEVFGELSRTK